MDFFQNQDVARQKTTRLVVFFCLAVVSIIAAIYLAAAVIFINVPPMQAERGPDFVEVSLWNPWLCLGVVWCTLVVILGGSWYKISQLGGGGKVVAQTLGGRLIDQSTSDIDERTLLNVVEEMAIASGTPVPPVYLLDENAINAFAAGYTINDAVIGVTRGCVQTLTRDELQGVVAHEFSHILNGDMRLNIRLIGLLHGILLIGLIGYYLIYSGSVSSRRYSSNKKGGGGGIILFGLACLVIGYVGVFFGKLIKSAVSRQREFLADASAVQFTRNPAGIAGALKKIGGLSQGARIENPNAEQTSHLFFGNALKSSFFNMMSTHPPLDVRIRRVEPSFDGSFPKVVRVNRTQKDLQHATVGLQQQQATAIRKRGSGRVARESAFQFQPEQAVADVGAPAAQHVAYAAALIDAMPRRIVDLAHEPYGARAVIYVLLLDEETEMRNVQLKRLEKFADPAVFQETRKLQPLLSEISPEMRLPMVEMTLPALRSLSANQYRSFRTNVKELVRADNKIQPFEYVLYRMLLNHLDGQFTKLRRPSVKYHSVKPVLSSCANLLSALAWLGHEDAEAASHAFQTGAERIVASTTGRLKFQSAEHSGISAIEEALKQLAQSSPGVKQRVLNGCAACIGADGRITVEEGELLRVIADSLDCPMPPLLAGQSSD